MNWDAVGALAELVGALAVVLSLLYLAAQVRENTKQARLDASRELATRISEASVAAATCGDLAELFTRGSGDPDALDPVEQTRYRGFMNTLFRGFEQQFLLRRAGALDDEMWTSVTEIIRDFAHCPVPRPTCAIGGAGTSARSFGSSRIRSERISPGVPEWSTTIGHPQAVRRSTPTPAGRRA